MFFNTVDGGGTARLAPDDSLLNDLVDANHILYGNGVLDAFGHVSARHNLHTDRFLLARSMAPALVTRNDILEFELDGTPVGTPDRPVYLERFIHASIYAARPDVMAVVHSHSPSVLPFGVVREAPLRPVFHMAGFIGSRAPVFEIRQFAGEDTDLLIKNLDLGDALAATLGDNSVVLMRGHGATAVSRTLRDAVYRAIYTEVNARIQTNAMQLGTVDFLTTGEAQAASLTNERQVDRAWDLWLRQLGRPPG